MSYLQNIFLGIIMVIQGIKKMAKELTNSWNYIYYMTHVSYQPVKNEDISKYNRSYKRF